ncbi:hypothetical protein GGR56DRAFT_50627 [Xylariaceae sp. FL0804]|nr:hypothetical protein GGR56DRAFT_50627 [Xylariaceae sp. FL0804]
MTWLALNDELLWERQSQPLSPWPSFMNSTSLIGNQARYRRPKFLSLTLPQVTSFSLCLLADYLVPQVLYVFPSYKNLVAQYVSTSPGQSAKTIASRQVALLNRIITVMVDSGQSVFPRRARQTPPCCPRQSGPSPEEQVGNRRQSPPSSELSHPAQNTRTPFTTHDTSRVTMFS